MVEQELGRPLTEVFEEFAPEPVAAASLAQVYRAKLRETGEIVAVKVQRPGVQALVSKDLYVLRRAAEVYQGLVKRFAPQQRTDYVALLNEWAVGFYTELDFVNEGVNMDRMRDLLEQQGVTDVAVPKVYHELTSRRLLVSEWVDGIKLSECEPEEIKELTKIGQEAFLVQLLQVGFFHSDPHPGNLLRPHDQSKAKLYLIDFGLVAQVRQEDMDGAPGLMTTRTRTLTGPRRLGCSRAPRPLRVGPAAMISSIIHLANKDYPALVDDFIDLKILPADCNRPKIVPLMDKALTPYVKGGGAKKYEEELKNMYGMDGSMDSTVGGFQAMTQDMLTVLNDIPFSIPPYFALLARAVVTLEGIALTADPDYGLVLEAYPFVARKLMSEDRPELQRALQQVLYGGGGGETVGKVTPTRLASLLNSAYGLAAKQEGAVFVDLDAVPEDGISLEQGLSFVLSEKGSSLRNLLGEEATTAADLLLRQALRKAVPAAFNALPRPPTLPFLPPPPDPLTLPAPFLLPDAAAPGGVRPALLPPQDVLEALAPKLTREEEIYALSLTDLAKQTLGAEVGELVGGDVAASPLRTLRTLLSFVASAPLPAEGGPLPDAVQARLPDAARQLSELLPEQRAATEHAQAGGSLGGVDEVNAAVAALDGRERAELDEQTGRVLAELQARLLQRVATLG